MDFPSYVPDGARRFAEHFLQGSAELRSEGYEALLAEWREELAEIDSHMRDRSRRSSEQTEISQSHQDEPAELRKRREQKAEDVQQLESDVAVIRRLIYDERMKEVYRRLLDTFFGEAEKDHKIDQFLHAAWAARIDYTKYRNRLRQARDQTEQIAETAERLADLLRRIGETGQYLPPEFYGVDCLLRETDSTDSRPGSQHVWRSLRRTILGDRSPGEREPQTDQDPEGGESELTIRVVELGEAAEIDPDEHARNTTRYAWGLAPPVSALLDTLAHAARRYEPAESGFIGAAVAKRQQNIKTEYLRGFAHLLRDEHRFDLTPPIMHAIATTANVVINDLEVDVSYDDVRKAVGAYS